MGDRITEIAEGALKVLGEKAPLKYPCPAGAVPASAGDPAVLDALFSGGKVLVSVRDLGCPKIDELRKDLARLSGSTSGLLFEVAAGTENDIKERKAAVPSSSTLSPEKQVLEEILADVISREGGPCVVEPGKTCVGCGGRCKTLGF